MGIAAAIASARYNDCVRCGGKCCKFFGVPAIYENVLKITGVPLNIYKTFDPDPSKYFGLHKGVTVKDNKFIVAKTLISGYCLCFPSPAQTFFLQHP